MNTIIPGVHNYCDRWCERCPFTERCAVFAMDKDLESSDVGEDAFWQTLSDRFAGTLQMLNDAAAKWDIVLAEPTESEMDEFREQENSIESELDANPLLQACEEYASGVEKLFKENPIWKEQGATLAQQTALGIMTIEKGLAEIDLVDDCHRVISWYQYFIAIKFRRALHSRFTCGDEAYEQQSDMHGSARIALIAIDRSRLALTTLYKFIPGDDQLLFLLAQLERIEKMGKEIFPLAVQFRRPGFDDDAGKI
jgi:hypothetical protein